MPTYDVFDHDRFRMMLVLLDARKPGGIPSVGACQLYGHIAMLERWLSVYHDDGDLTGISPERIEVAAGWHAPEVPREMAGLLHEVLVESGLLHICHNTDTGIGNQPDSAADGATCGGPRVRFRGWPACAPYYVREKMRKRNYRNKRQNGECVPDTCADLRLSRVEKRREDTQSYSERPFSSVSGSTPKKVRAHFSVARAAQADGNGKGDGADDCADAADTAADADAAGAAKKRSGAATKAYALIAAKYTDTQWAALPPVWKASELLALMGCDESFRKTVAQKAQRDGRIVDALLKLLVRFIGRRKAIDNAGGWVRTALAAEGFAV